MVDLLKYHLRHSPKGVEALNTARRLEQLLQQTRQKCMETLSNVAENQSHTSSVLDQLEEMENGRAKAEQALRQSTIGMCEQSAMALRWPLQQEHQRQVQAAIFDFERKIEHFSQLIEQISSQFAKLQEKVMQALSRTGMVPQAVYTKKVLKLAGPEGDDENFAPKDTTNVACSSKQLKNFDQMAIFITPQYVDFLLEQISKFLTPLKAYWLEGEFGKGGQGRVYKARLMAKTGPTGFSASQDQHVALKVERITLESCLDILGEVVFTCGNQFYQNLHPNILTAIECSIFGTVQNDYYLALVFEAMNDGSLDNYAQEQWPEQYIAYLMKQVLLALVYIHSFCVVHNDIKPGNILLKAGIVKLADFGRATQLAQFDSKRSGTLRFMAPEVAIALLNNGRENEEFSTAIDIWALGATMYELLENKHPYYNYEQCNVLDAIATTGLFLEKDGDYSSDVKKFFQLLTVTEPSNRPSAESLLNDPFIAKACSSSEFANFINQLKNDQIQRSKAVKHIQKTDL